MRKLPAKQTETTQPIPGSEVGSNPKFNNKSPLSLSCLDILEKGQGTEAENAALQFQKQGVWISKEDRSQ